MFSSTVSAFSALLNFFRDFFSSARDVEPNNYFSTAEIAKLFTSNPQHMPDAVDDQTWRDLDIDTFIGSISNKTSIFGRQVLYLKMRGGKFAANGFGSADNVERMIESESLAHLDAIFRPLRRAADEVGSLMWSDPDFVRSRWADWIPILQAVLTVSLLGIWFSPYFALVSVSVIFISVGLQVALHSELAAWAGKCQSLIYLLQAAPNLVNYTKKVAIEIPHNVEYLSYERLREELSCSSAAAAIPGVGEYLDWFFSENIRKHYRSQRAFKRNFFDLTQCYAVVASLEADLALASDLTRREFYCRANINHRRRISFDQVVHPQLAHAIAVSFSLEHISVFLSGKNGIGKSTFLRTIGINLIVGKSFGYCYAMSCDIPASPIYSSIKNEDSLSGGESLYTSELIRARELLNYSKIHNGAIFLIDEIFRGTNYVDSVATAAAVLHELSLSATVIVSSHNLALSAIVSEQFRALRLERDKSKGMVRLVEGLLIDTNGISLLSDYNFDGDVQARAKDIALWLRSYLTQPVDCYKFTTIKN